MVVYRVWNQEQLPIDDVPRQLFLLAVLQLQMMKETSNAVPAIEIESMQMRAPHHMYIAALSPAT